MNLPIFKGPMNLIDQLNDEQKEAVNTIEGPLLVVAGAGSGKTRVVTLRIAHLIDIGVPPSQILGLTFTNKAAEEMKDRVRNLTQSNVLICTFHSLGARILRESIHLLGYSRGFTIYDEEDTDSILRACFSELGFSEQKLEIKTFRNLISKAKNNLLLPSEVDKSNISLNEKIFPDIYDHYQKKLHQYNALDFDDLLFLTVRLLSDYPEALEHYQNRWSFFLIDEYQDTNAAQYTLIKLLAAKNQNLCVVGDPDQSIYSWRGANMKNILNFETDYANVKVIRLEQNYRSRNNILDAANALISNNTKRYQKNLWSNLGNGEKIRYFSGDNEQSEAQFLVERIRYHKEQHDIPLNQMVVFYRTNFQSRIFEDYFLSKHIPYVIIGGISFYQRKEIKDILAYLRIVHSGSDFISFSRTINLPKRGIGDVTIEKIRSAAAQEKRSIFSYCEALVEGQPLDYPLKLSPRPFEGLKEYVRLIHELREINHAGSLRELVRSAIEQSRYLESLKEDKETFNDRKENLDALVTKAVEWESSAPDPSLAAFLEELSLKSNLDEADTSKDRINLMTIHNGKGLEYTVVFLVGLEENLFPHANAKDDEEAIEEERRLCYVGMTRAKEFLYLVNSNSRFMWGARREQRPSRFIREIPAEYIEKTRRSLIQSQTAYEPVKKSRPPVKEHVRFIDDIDQTLTEPFVNGDAIFHQEFGVGIIKDVYQGSLGLTYKILFSKDNRERSIIAKYAYLKRL